MSVALLAPSPRPSFRFPGFPQGHAADGPARVAGSARASAVTIETRVEPHPDSLALVAARQGSSAAFETLVRRYQGPLFNFSLRLLGKPEDAGDVVQDAFIQLYSHLAQLDEQEPISPWLFRVARNRCIDVIRKRRTVQLTVDDDEDAPFGPAEPVDETPLPDELAERADLQRLLGVAIASLPPAYAEVVSLRYAADRSFAEIAQIVGCDEGAARVRFHRAKGLLRRVVAERAADFQGWEG